MFAVGIWPATVQTMASFDREHTNIRIAPLSPLARTALAPSLSLSAAFPLPFYCLTARFCRLSYLHRLPKQGPPSRQPPTSRHNLSTLALLFVLLPPHQTHRLSPSTILIASPIPSTFGYATHIRLQLSVQSRGLKNAHKFFN